MTHPARPLYNKTMSKQRIELLAPAGGVTQLIAAVENGADAVYLGGRLFNARMNAGNFDDETMQQAIDYAHQHGVAVHVTLNTLLREEELPEALKYAAFLYAAGVDALIIQDLGLAKLIHQFMPDLPLHFSTQGTTYDLRGVEAAVRLGFSRVVLARELSLTEIRQICKGTDVEIEVFCHGALCVCYSGQCQLSRFFGGRSGNRGACAQPCRLPYETVGGQGNVRYPLSPKDQCLIDHLGELIEAGVRSLKIEGRMKSPEYVGTVVAIYRKYIDNYYRSGHCRVSEEDREALAQIFNRGGFTDGYLRGNDGMELMAGDIPKHQGIFVGTVKARIKGTALVDMALSKPLAKGDSIEIRGRSVEGCFVTWLEKRGPLWRIGDIDGEVHPGDKVYRLFSKSQLVSVRRTFQGFSLSGDSTKPTACRTRVSARVIGKGENLELVLKHESGRTVQVPAALHGDMELDEERLAAALRKTGATAFTVTKVDIRGRFLGGLRVAEMNALRRQGMAVLEDALRVRRLKPTCWYQPMETRREGQITERYLWELPDVERTTDPEDLYRKQDQKEVLVVPVKNFVEKDVQLCEGKTVIPWISNVTRGEESNWLEEHFDQVVEACRETGIYVGNLSWIAPFREAGVPVYGDFGLNVYNSQAEAALASLGVEHCVDSLEAVDFREAGKVPLMTLQHTPDGERLLAKRHEALRILRRPDSDQTLLVPEEGECADVRGNLYRSGVRRVYGI